MTKILKPLASFASLYRKPSIVCAEQSIRKSGFFKRCEPKEEPFLICKATPGDSCEILDLMWEAYHPHEPTTAALGLGRCRNTVLDDQSVQTLCKGLSLVARCKQSGDIIGAALNDVNCPWDPDNMEKFACTLNCIQLRQLYMFYAYIQRAPNLWETCCQPHVFEIAMLFVRPCDRNKGISKKLIQASTDLAADAGYRVARIDCTTAKTAAICEKLKMTKVFELPYCAYVGEDNQPIFKIPEPDRAVKVYITMPHAMKK